MFDKEFFYLSETQTVIMGKSVSVQQVDTGHSWIIGVCLTKGFWKVLSRKLKAFISKTPVCWVF